MTHLATPLRIGSLQLNNRLYRAPVLEGAGNSPDPSAVYARHFVPNARSGLGLIIQGNTVVLPEGRTSPGMSSIDGKERMLALQTMTRAVHDAGGKIITQLGHGGIFSLESWHTGFRPQRSLAPYAPSPLPFWLQAVHRTQIHVLSTQDVKKLVERFGIVASWAREAGYDGVQLAGANTKLLHQFLSSIYNRRSDQYGGSVENRMRFLVEIREAIGREAGNDYPVLLKYSAVEEGVFSKGITLEEGVQIAKMAESVGFAAVTPVISEVLPNSAISRGDYPGASFSHKSIHPKLLQATGSKIRLSTVALGMWLAARKYPFTPVWNRDVFRAVKQAIGIPVFAVGGIRTPAEANDILSKGEADMIGIGRPFYAEPELAVRFLAAAASSNEPTLCQNCNQCLVPQMLGLAGVCYNVSVNKHRRHAPEKAGRVPILV